MLKVLIGSAQRDASNVYSKHVLCADIKKKKKKYWYFSDKTVPYLELLLDFVPIFQKQNMWAKNKTYLIYLTQILSIICCQLI